MAGADELGSVIKALTVLQCFSAELPRATATEMAEAAHVTRPTARRILLTFVDQGFVATDGKAYWPTPKVMRLGFSYLSTLPFWELAQSHLRLLAEQLDESCSLATLDGTDVVYVSRVSMKRSVIQLNIGSRLPAHATSLGKAILAFSDAAVVDEFLRHAPFESLTPNTVVTADDIRAQLAVVRERGFAVNDGEREIGVRSAAAPVLNRRGEALAAVNVSANAMRVSAEQLTDDFAPALVATARAISEEIAYTGR